MRDVPLLDRKQRLAKLLGKAKHSIHFNEHLAHDGATVFQRACRMGLEGIVSKRVDAPIAAGRLRHGLNPRTRLVRPSAASGRKSGLSKSSLI